MIISFSIPYSLLLTSFLLSLSLLSHSLSHSLSLGTIVAIGVRQEEEILKRNNENKSVMNNNYHASEEGYKGKEIELTFTDNPLHNTSRDNTSRDNTSEIVSEIIINPSSYIMQKGDSLLFMVDNLERLITIWEKYTAFKAGRDRSSKILPLQDDSMGGSFIQFNSSPNLLSSSPTGTTGTGTNGKISAGSPTGAGAFFGLSSPTGKNRLKLSI